MDTLDLPAADYLPHKPPMLFVQRLRAISANSVTCETTLDKPTFAPFANNNTLPSALLMEIMAQTIGVWSGWQCRAAQKPIQPGLILGCRDFLTSTATLHLDTRIRSTARIIFQDEDTATFENTIEKIPSEKIATALLTTRRISWHDLETLLTPPK